MVNQFYCTHILFFSLYCFLPKPTIVVHFKSQLVWKGVSFRIIINALIVLITYITVNHLLVVILFYGMPTEDHCYTVAWLLYQLNLGLVQAHHQIQFITTNTP
jgi:hypothetical protein